MKAAVEAEEMRMKGYSYQQETARKVGLEAMKNGLVGEGGGALGGIGDLAGLGIGLGAMGSVIGMTRDAVGPLISDAGQAVQNTPAPDASAPAAAGAWDCTCGQKGLTGKFCPECGAKRPQPETWDCICGQKNLTGRFCPECGKPKGE